MLFICLAYADYNQITFIGCPNNSDHEPWHTAQSIPATTSRLDLNHLRTLIYQGQNLNQNTCTYVGQVTERRTKCGKLSKHIISKC
jgi:hypothetical protein